MTLIATGSMQESNSNEPPLSMPSPNEILEAIGKWRSLDLRKLLKSDIQKKFDGLFSSLLQVIIVKNVMNKSFQRVRSFEYLFEEEEELWAPPKRYAKKNRCNFEKSPMLYTSEQSSVCFEELGITPGKQAYLIKYSRIEPLELCYVYRTLSDENLSVFDKDGQLAYKIMKEFIMSEFTKPSCPKCSGNDFVYNASAAICNQLHSTKKMIDGFIYPSTVRGNCNNFSFFPASARKKLKIEDVRIVKLMDKKSFCKLPFMESRSKYQEIILQGRSHYSINCFKGIIGDRIKWEPMEGITLH